MDYKSIIIITLTTIILLTLIVTGIYVSTKEIDNIEDFQESNVIVDDSSKTDLGEAQTDTTQEESIKNNINLENNEETIKGQSTITDSNITNVGVMNSATTGNISNEDYITERQEEVERLVYEGFLVGWKPITLNSLIDDISLNTPDINTSYITVSGNKTWVDNNNKYEKRPEQIKVRLLENGTEIASKIVTKKDNWSYEFKDLPEFKGINKITYTIIEDEIEGYTTTIDGYNITNTYNMPEGIVTRNWDTSTTTEIPVPVDVVFVLDTSKSMIQGTTRGTDMITAVNNAMGEILSFNSYNRVSVVGFSEDGLYGDLHQNKSDASILLTLGRYTINDTSNNKSYLVKEADYIFTNVKRQNSSGVYENYATKTRYFEQGTYTQAGIKLGAEQLINEKEITANVDGKTVKRVPVIIILSDGEPTVFSINYTNPKINTSTYNSDKLGTGQLSNTSALYGYYTILTANYYKTQVTSHYGSSTKVFTIAMDLGTYYGETVLNPSPDKVVNCKNYVEADNENNTINNKQISQDLYKYLNYETAQQVGYIEFKRDINGKIQKTSEGKLQYITNVINVLASPYRQTSQYADRAFKEKMTADELKTAMIGSITETIPQSITWTITEEERNEGKVYLPKINKEGTFSLIMNLNETEYKKYTNCQTAMEDKVIIGNEIDGYYIDLKQIPAASYIEIDYRQK